MQRITSVMWTLDNKYIMSGSDEMNIRIWKAKAWEKLGTVSDFFSPDFMQFHAIFYDTIKNISFPVENS